ncbi:unnamed protein product, partial [Brassica oleracea var. botrytis]
CLSTSSKSITPTLQRRLTTSVINLDRDASSSLIQMVCASLLLLPNLYVVVWDCICSGLGLFVLRPVLISVKMNFDSGQVLGGADGYLITPTLIWKVSKPSLVRQIHLSVWFLSAGASQNNRSRKIKELDKKVRHKL